MSTLQTDNLQTLDGQNTHDVATMGTTTITNGDGVAIQFADGTMICTGEGTMTPTTSSSDRFGTTSGTTYFDTEFIDFPSAFTQVYQAVAGNTGGGNIMSRVVTLNNSNMEMHMTGKTSGASVGYNYIAIGRWK